jgi:hypothetical protein
LPRVARCACDGDRSERVRWCWAEAWRVVGV